MQMLAEFSEGTGTGGQGPTITVGTQIVGDQSPPLEMNLLQEDVQRVSWFIRYNMTRTDLGVTAVPQVSTIVETIFNDTAGFVHGFLADSKCFVFPAAGPGGKGNLTGAYYTWEQVAGKGLHHLMGGKGDDSSDDGGKVGGKGAGKAEGKGKDGKGKGTGKAHRLVWPVAALAASSMPAASNGAAGKPAASGEFRDGDALSVCEVYLLPPRRPCPPPPAGEAPTEEAPAPLEEAPADAPAEDPEAVGSGGSEAWRTLTYVNGILTGHDRGTRSRSPRVATRGTGSGGVALHDAPHTPPWGA